MESECNIIKRWLTMHRKPIVVYRHVEEALGRNRLLVLETVGNSLHMAEPAGIRSPVHRMHRATQVWNVVNKSHFCCHYHVARLWITYIWMACASSVPLHLHETEA